MASYFRIPTLQTQHCQIHVITFASGKKQKRKILTEFPRLCDFDVSMTPFLFLFSRKLP